MTTTTYYVVKMNGSVIGGHAVLADAEAQARRINAHPVLNQYGTATVETTQREQ